MRILLLGATGRTGKWVLYFALQNGYAVNILVRDVNKFCAGPNLKVFQGTTSNLKDVEKAAVGCDAILSVLNISRTSDFPWAKLRTPKTFLSDTIHNCIEVSRSQGLKRIVVCSAWGVAETNVDLPFWFRWTIKYSNIGIAYNDHERQEDLLKETDSDWTVIRPVGLINSRKPQRIQISYNNKPKPKLTISRKSVALFMVNAVKDDALIGKSPVVSGVKV